MLLNADVHDALIDSIPTVQGAPAAETDYWIGLHKARWIWDASGNSQIPLRYPVADRSEAL